jgi:hypothetical protein
MLAVAQGLGDLDDVKDLSDAFTGTRYGLSLGEVSDDFRGAR